MVFRIQQKTIYNRSSLPSSSHPTSSLPILSDSQKLANKMMLESTQIHKYGKHFLYYQPEISKYVINEIYKPNTEEVEKVEKIEKEDFVFDKNTTKWILVKKV